MEEIASRLSGSQVFSVLDAKSAFWQIKLDDSSKDLTTFYTPFGRYRFLHLPFGLNSAAEVFAKCFHQAFEDIPGNETYMDFFFFFFWRSPAISLGFTHFWVRFLRMWPFFNPTIKVVTFCLRGWCVLGVFLLPAFIRLGHERQDLLSLCDEMHVCTD